MKVLCIRAYAGHGVLPKLFAGHVYTAVGELRCSCPGESGWEIEGANWKGGEPGEILRCVRCHQVLGPRPRFGVYRKSRFIPLEPPKGQEVSQEEVNKLYNPTKKENSNAPVPQRT